MLCKLFHKIIEGNKQNIISRITRRIFHHLRKVDNNTILFLSSNAGTHSELYAIAKTMANQKFPFTIYWAADNGLNSPILPKQIKRVSIGSYKFFRALAISRILVEDSFAFSSFHLQKKTEQVLIQTWENTLYEAPHNCFIGNTSYSFPEQLKQTDQIDYCIAGNLLETKFFHSVLDTDVPVLAYGHARNDQFFAIDKRKNIKSRQKINNTFKISPTEYIFCYETSQTTNLSAQEIQMLKQALEEKFSGNWVIISEKSSSFPVYADAYLCERSEHGLDYILSQCPCFFLERNIDSATPERSFIKTPFPVNSTISGVTEQILRFDKDTYKKQLFLFFREYGMVEDGHASERIMEKIQEIV